MCMEDSGSQHNIAVCTMTIWNTNVITVLMFSPWEKWWKTRSIRNYVWSLPPSYPAPVITEITHGTCTCVIGFLYIPVSPCNEMKLTVTFFFFFKMLLDEVVKKKQQYLIFVMHLSRIFWYLKIMFIGVMFLPHGYTCHEDYWKWNVCVK